MGARSCFFTLLVGSTLSQAIEVWFGFSLLVLLAYVMMRGVQALVLQPPNCVEFGERFSYRNISGVHPLDWTDVKTLRFKYAHIYQGEEPHFPDASETRLIVTLAK